MDFSHRITPKDAAVICIDLDGTIISGGHYPGYGLPFPYAIKTINEMVAVGYEVIIWTSRDWTTLAQVLNMLHEDYGLTRQIKVNEHSDYCLARFPKSSPKVYGHVYLDDLAWNAPDYSTCWPELYRVFVGHMKGNEHVN